MDFIKAHPLLYVVFMLLGLGILVVQNRVDKWIRADQKRNDSYTKMFFTVVPTVAVGALIIYFLQSR
ncbi:hypothetical protein [Falsarthrobacter nasiphocae]|uniref:Prolipoprotein diacylglyceryltransferase n=1 Tax=Falsarthrobacter nasiphocae TaxID=189863 RepID=A0AAE3YH65_9MICC|nr:hypothetical protein [Falsarthrobacter nasiphocae]MDR6891853.1 prolipoprotein diacylglyceryltransferase [Falsarthrobacter nasiphocae]